MMKICTRSAGEIWSLHRCPTGQNSIRERAIKFDSLLHDPPIYWFNQRNNSHCIRREIGGQTPEPIVLTKIGKKEICFSLFGQVRENRKILKIYIKSARSLSKIQRNFPIFRRDIFDKIFHVVFFSQESCQNVESLRIKIREDFKKFRKKIRESPRFRSKLSIFGYREFEILKLARISNNFSYNFWQEQFTKYFRNFPSCLGHEWINPRIFAPQSRQACRKIASLRIKIRKDIENIVTISFETSDIREILKLAGISNVSRRGNFWQEEIIPNEIFHVVGPVHESCTRNCGKLVERWELNDGRTLDEAIDIDSSEKFCQPANKCVRNGPVTLYTLRITGCVSIKGYLLQRGEGGGECKCKCSIPGTAPWILNVP